ncbi:MAG: FecR domain-containing protein [Planctomycetota bacterium]
MSIPQPIQDLLQAYFEGDTSSETSKAIEAWLKEDPTNLRRFAEYGIIEDMLFSEQQSIDSEAVHTVITELEPSSNLAFVDMLEQQPFASENQAQAAKQITSRELLSAGSYVLRHSLTPRAIAILVAAATLLLGAVLAIVFLTGGPDEIEPIAKAPGTVGEQSDVKMVVATLTGEHDAIWGRRPGEDLFVGQRLELMEGFAEITTRRGAVAILEAPTTIELLDNNNAVYLHAGKLVGLCHTKPSKGFVVKTDQADITDLGTEFGVTAGLDGLESTVFTGEIAVKAGLEPAKVVRQHQTARVSVENESTVLAVDDVLIEGYTRRMPRPPLVRTARVVNGGKHQASIDPQGFYEQALLYSDRDYRLMPSPGQTLPEAMLGGDIVKMPVDLIRQRTGDVIEVELTTDQPVTVYLLRPPNATTDGWLERDYVNTGMTFGIYSQLRNQRICEVWQRKSTAAGTTTVAWDVNRRGGDGMYTLVVTPADNE